MLEVAKQKTSSKIEYICEPLEDIEFPEKSFGIVTSSLTFHYLKSFDEVAKKIFNWLIEDGDFVFSVEHPILTSYGTQDWYTAYSLPLHKETRKLRPENYKCG